MSKTWNSIVQPFLKSEKGIKLKKFVEEQRKIATIYPAKEDMLRAIKEEVYPYENVKVVIIGQDPYHNGSADGLAFSCRSSTTPDSLRNIFKELKNNLYSYMNENTWKEFIPSNSLDNWAKQGILLLNTVLTVEEGKPNSHKDQGWEELTYEIVTSLGREKRPIVFLLWGNNAKAFKQHIFGSNHLVLESVHPSPFSADKGFFGNKHFTEVHNFFKSCDYYKDKMNKESIDLRQMFKAEEIISSIKRTVSSKQIPMDNAKERIDELQKILLEDYLWDMEYMFNFSTKTN
jgi:uracil-DNA glycosylase